MKKLSLFLLLISLQAATVACDKEKPSDPTEPTEIGVSIGGVTWATRNVGAPGKFAETPESYGMYYQFDKNVGWDESVESSDGSSWSITNPVTGAWSTKNDPCPKGWRLPTNGEHLSLMEVTSASEAAVDGVNGMLFTEDNGSNSIFMPFAGNIIANGEKFPGGTLGFYWSGTPYGDGAQFGCYLFMGNGLVRSDDGIGFASACSVRCVRNE